MQLIYLLGMNGKMFYVKHKHFLMITCIDGIQLSIRKASDVCFMGPVKCLEMLKFFTHCHRDTVEYDIY